MSFKKKIRTGIILFTMATLAYSVATKKRHGRFLGIPYDWRIPSLTNIKKILWNKNDPKLFNETVFGVGWAPNAYQFLKKFESSKLTSSEKLRIEKDS